MPDLLRGPLAGSGAGRGWLLSGDLSGRGDLAALAVAEVMFGGLGAD